MSENQSNQLWRVDTWFPQVPGEARRQLKIYFDELHKFNKAINLVSAKTLPLADAIHFSDSIIGGQFLLEDIGASDKPVFDFGSGNGFPGLVLAAMAPGRKFVLLDADQRKCEFLKSTASAMGTRNVEVLCQTVESLPVGSVYLGVCRGLANISKTILMLRKCFAENGVQYHFKGEQWSMEVAEIPTQLCSEWSPALVQEYKLPIGPTRFALVKTTRLNVK